ncbi:MAG: class I SAM-dependent methyltransferase [Alphaproteobacteria bacterium]
MATPLAARIEALIRKGGPITVARFMEEALGHYYRHGEPIGRQGDFITAPEISQIFGELLGAWCAVVWRGMGRPSRVALVELGPGYGTLMADILRAIEAVAPDFAGAASVHLVETSPALRRAQTDKLGARPLWHDDISSLPDAPLIVLANEFFDALPVHQIVARNGAWHERRVGIAAGGGFAFETDPEPSPLADLVPAGISPTPDSAIFELNLAASEIVGAIADRIAAHGGAGLIVDYGHAASAAGETLQAVRNHAYEPVLADPGQADLTCHVDFAALGRAASGAAIHGPVSQRDFLIALGIEARAEKLQDSAKTAPAREAIATGVARLIDPRGMGTLFKILAMSRPGQPTPPGFETP